MRVLMINVVCGIRSTGRICTDLATALEAQGHEVKIAYGRGQVPEQFQKYAVQVGNDFDVLLHGVRARLLDGAGFGSRYATKRFIKWVKEYNPDVIHLHNIHGYYINIEILFEYLRYCGKKIIWTMHDCWAFTGHCTYFDYVGCEKWKTGCEHCIQKTEYPARIGPDMSNRNYHVKKRLFTSIPNLVLVTPSKWLENLVKESFLKDYRTIMIHNGVDTTIFKPTKSNIKKCYACENKKVILGVAAVWDKRKGLNTFIELAQKLDSTYQIILVGLSRKQLENLPDNVIGIEKTNNVEELIKLYSAADVFVNPTLEDNYPTTNIEAIACGTPVISFDTGGSSESANMFGMNVPQKNIDLIIKAIANMDIIYPRKIDIDYKNAIYKYIEIYQEI